MKLIISNSFAYNANMAIDIEQQDGMGLMSLLLTHHTNDESFKRLAKSAMFIFDKVEDFKPNIILSDSDDIYIAKAIKRVKTKRDSGGFRTINEVIDDVKNYSKVFEGGRVEEIVNSIIPDLVKNEDGLILTNDPFLTSMQIKRMEKFSTENLIYCLATSGIDICIPNVAVKSKEEISKIKSRFNSERIEYLQYLETEAKTLLQECKSSHPDYRQIYDYAKNSFSAGLRLKCQRVNAAIDRSENEVKSKIEEAVVGQVPAIIGSIMKRDLEGAMVSLLELLMIRPKESRIEKEWLKKFPDAAYIYNVSKEIM